MTVISDDSLLCSVMGDALAESHQVRRAPRGASMSRLADTQPDVLVVGPIASASSASTLTAWQIVALVRAHRELRRVPIVVLASDLSAVMADPGVLSAHDGVHALGIPFDLDTLTSVLASVQRAVQAEREALPVYCSHGYESGPDGPADCSFCSWPVSHTEPERSR